MCRERAAKRPQDFSADANIAGAAAQPFRDTRPLLQRPRWPTGLRLRHDEPQTNRNLSVNLDHLLECIKTLVLEEYVLRIGDNVSIGA
ncbi:hypothetical protein D9M71_827780 [compost metagenome]